MKKSFQRCFNCKIISVLQKENENVSNIFFNSPMMELVGYYNDTKEIQRKRKYLSQLISRPVKISLLSKYWEGTSHLKTQKNDIFQAQEMANVKDQSGEWV